MKYATAALMASTQCWNTIKTQLCPACCFAYHNTPLRKCALWRLDGFLPGKPCYPCKPGQLWPGKPDNQSVDSPGKPDNLQSHSPAKPDNLQSHSPGKPDNLQSHSPAKPDNLQSHSPAKPDNLQSHSPAKPDNLQSRTPQINLTIILSHSPGQPDSHSVTPSR